MRSLVVMSAAVVLLGADAAGAQRMVARGPGVSYPAPTITGHAPMAMHGPMQMQPPMQMHRQMHMPTRSSMQEHRWGNKINGRWGGGFNAPGGWNSYRRPSRGWALPSYWVSPSFVISDWSTYGLAQPPRGYNWSRYYDDAVMIDGRGSVYDSVSDVDWDRYDGGSYADGSYADNSYDGADERYYPRRDDGVGGAVTGAVVGGVAGNLIAGRGSRLGGTLIGAGVGAAAGYAIDKAEDDRRGPPPRDYRGGYDRGYGDMPPPPPPPPPRFHGAPGGAWVSPDGGTRVVTTSGGYGGSTTVVVVQSAPVVTTTTTEIYEDAVTYSRPKKTVYRKRIWRPRPKCGCR